jgi:hypothetical protein
MCAEGWYAEDSPPADGECPECGDATFEGDAVEGCFYGRDTCDVCGGSPCDGGC